MAEMNSVDRQRLLTALILAVMALFVSAGAPGAGRWRRQLRGAAIVGFAVAVALALVEIGLWLTGAEW